MELVNIMNLNSLSIEDHQSEIGRFFDNNVFIFTIDIGNIVDILSSTEEIKKCFRSHCNKIFLNNSDNSDQQVIIDFDKIPYITLDSAGAPARYKGNVHEWLENPVPLFTVVMNKDNGYYQTMAKPVYGEPLEKVYEQLASGKLTNELNIKPLISKLLTICVTDSVSGYSYGNDNLLIKCDMRGKPYFANKQEDMDLTYLRDNVDAKDIINHIEKTKYLQFICNEIAEHTSDYPFNITKICTEGNTITIFVGNDARILAWHTAKLEELERKKEYAELNGLPYR